MAAKAKPTKTVIVFKKRFKRKLRRHTKTLTHSKGSKNYVKKYRGQGR